VPLRGDVFGKESGSFDLRRWPLFKSYYYRGAGDLVPGKKGGDRWWERDGCAEVFERRKKGIFATGAPFIKGAKKTPDHPDTPKT